jgi:hypothetical protein
VLRLLQSDSENFVRATLSGGSGSHVWSTQDPFAKGSRRKRATSMSDSPVPSGFTPSCSLIATFRNWLGCRPLPQNPRRVCGPRTRRPRKVDSWPSFRREYPRTFERKRFITVDVDDSATREEPMLAAAQEQNIVELRAAIFKFPRGRSETPR